ncbi:MAG: divalent-cation tolerance protein CutA, partial [Gemmatimonadetes bacterium]|nr:divalent-cation tolerance protein CutA [Gemmatimonadota bacterium]NNL31132.1 divalent-cation tolerance protein CutA [Gemmatimonadota bacterium]
MTSPEAAVTVVLTTAPDAEVAEALATRVVDERLAACANIVPGITSIYRWEGEVQRDAEVLVILKTT